MDFSDALRAVKDGKTVTRPLWREAFGDAVLRLIHVECPGVAPQPLLAVFHGDGTFGPLSGGQLDLLAQDWEIVL